MLHFKVLNGKHAQGEDEPVRSENGTPLLDEFGNPRTRRIIRVYGKDDIVHTNLNLAKKFNPPLGSGMKNKFEEMSEAHVEEYIRQREAARLASIDTPLSAQQTPQQQLQILQQQIYALQEQLVEGNYPMPEPNVVIQNQPINHPPGTGKGGSSSSSGNKGTPGNPTQNMGEFLTTPIVQAQMKAPQYHNALDEMSVKELQDFAKSEEVDLKGVKSNKEDLIRAIRAAGLGVV